MSDPLTISSLTFREFQLFRDLIYQEAGIALGEGKQQLVASRLSRRLRALNLTTYRAYYDYLRQDDLRGEERLRMINCLTTNKTDFFRESHHFDYLKSTVFPQLERRARETGERRLRIWSAACSTGEEPYTLAMTILDHFGPPAIHGWDIRILASDVDTDVLAHAENGEYEADRVADVPKHVLSRYFLKLSKAPDTAVRVRPELRELVTFRRINFIEPKWPIQTTFDVIFCRNVMIYFDEGTQDQLLTRFSHHLVSNGHLFIGHSESILRLDHLYRSLGNTIYQLNRQTEPAAALSTSASSAVQQSVVSAPAVRAVTGSGHSSRPTAAKRRLPRSAAPAGQPTSGPALRSADLKQLPTRAIIVGEIEASAEPLRVTTLVGSCVAVCLYDPMSQIGGMNHFMLPANCTSNHVCATYGIHAMELLINKMMCLGADRRRIVAKVFGGGDVLKRQSSQSTFMNIGSNNIRFALEFLNTDGIPIAAQDVGGDSGRQIHFLTHTGQAFVRPVRESALDESELRSMKAAPAAVTDRNPAGSVVLF